ncbi:uncharacterized protein [Lepidochelys kempii]|uniref:uncharacterized protein isoform X2 n=1 Tax=Lepidochelys kempii TaxID=8472 RepID=UPI003C6F0BBE
MRVSAFLKRKTCHRLSREGFQIPRPGVVSLTERGGEACVQYPKDPAPETHFGGDSLLGPDQEADAIEWVAEQPREAPSLPSCDARVQWGWSTCSELGPRGQPGLLGRWGAGSGAVPDGREDTSGLQPNRQQSQAEEQPRPRPGARTRARSPTPAPRAGRASSSGAHRGEAAPGARGPSSCAPTWCRTCRSAQGRKGFIRHSQLPRPGDGEPPCRCLKGVHQPTNLATHQWTHLAEGALPCSQPGRALLSPRESWEQCSLSIFDRPCAQKISSVQMAVRAVCCRVHGVWDLRAPAHVHSLQGTGPRREAADAVGGWRSRLLFSQACIPLATPTGS